jgi:uncharacterized membrane protein
MYIGLLHLHNVGRWLVLVAAVVAIVIAVLGLVRGAPWGRGAKLSGLAYLVMMDTQLLIGLVLYGLSPLVRAAMGDMSLAMSDTQLRFFLIEHFALMVVAVALVHVGYALAKRASTVKAAYARASVFYTLGLVAVLAGIPWWRPLFPGA